LEAGQVAHLALNDEEGLGPATTVKASQEESALNVLQGDDDLALWRNLGEVNRTVAHHQRAVAAYAEGARLVQKVGLGWT